MHRRVGYQIFELIENDNVRKLLQELSPDQLNGRQLKRLQRASDGFIESLGLQWLIHLEVGQSCLCVKSVRSATYLTFHFARPLGTVFGRVTGEQIRFDDLTWDHDAGAATLKHLAVPIKPLAIFAQKLEIQLPPRLKIATDYYQAMMAEDSAVMRDLQKRWATIAPANRSTPRIPIAF